MIPFVSIHSYIMHK